jgi:signal transduction histidine kinase
MMGTALPMERSGLNHRRRKPPRGARSDRTADRRSRELDVLFRVAARIHEEEDVQALLDAAVEELADGMGLHTAWIVLGDSRERFLRVAATPTLSPQAIEGLRSRSAAECACHEAHAASRRSLSVDEGACARLPLRVDGATEPAAYACVPLSSGGLVHGFLNVAVSPNRAFGDEELRFLETLGRLIALASERARHRRAERARAQQTSALASINKAIGGTLDATAILQAVGDTAREILGADRTTILLGSNPDALRIAHVAGSAHSDFAVGGALDLVRLGASLHLHALENRRIIVVDDLGQDSRVNQPLAETWGMGSAILSPLLAGPRLLGLLVVSRRAPFRWAEEQIDIAEALAAQASVGLENARLYEEARRAYQELKDAQAQIIQSEKMAVVGTFASGLAHEVRNPLNSIALQLSLLERRVIRLEPTLAAEVQELLAVIREEVRRLDSLVGDFLQFSRTDRMQLTPTSLESTIDEVLRLLWPEARASRVRLGREPIGEPIPPLTLDAEKMKQVVINLVRNSIEAMPGGGEVTVGSGVEGGRALMSVRDNGPGLPEGLDVFQLFVTTKARGTGLGLSIAQQIVLEHGGEIVAEPSPGGGATFRISLPLSRREGASGEGLRT